MESWQEQRQGSLLGQLPLWRSSAGVTSGWRIVVSPHVALVVQQPGDVHAQHVRMRASTLQCNLHYESHHAHVGQGVAPMGIHKAKSDPRAHAHTNACMQVTLAP